MDYEGLFAIKRSGYWASLFSSNQVGLFPLLIILMMVAAAPLFFGCRGEEEKTLPKSNSPAKLGTPPKKSETEKILTPIMIDVEPTWEGADKIHPIYPGRLSGESGEGDDGNVNLEGDTAENVSNGENIFSLQLGAFIFDKNLNRVRDEVSTFGYLSYVKEINREIDFYCPIVGENLNKDEAKELIKELYSEGFDPVPLENKKGIIDVASGLFYYEEDARVSLKELKELGYKVKIDERKVDVTFKRLRIGSYDNIEDAKKVLSLLKERGFSPIIVNKDQ